MPSGAGRRSGCPGSVPGTACSSGTRPPSAGSSGARAVFAADVTYRKGKDVPLKGIVDDALDAAGEGVERVVVLRRSAGEVPMRAGRDITWDEFLALGAGQDPGHAVMESNDPAYI